MTNPKLMKVSDEEREKALESLSRALATGRIGYQDFEARVDRALAAKNYIELGDVVVDLPIRAPRPEPEPHRYDYLPDNAPPRPAPQHSEMSEANLDPRMWPSRSRVVAVMSLRAVVVLLAVGLFDERLVVGVLPSASPVVGAGVILIAALAALLAVYNTVACWAAIPAKIGRPPDRPPRIGQ
jgi:hypothetical protein